MFGFARKTDLKQLRDEMQELADRLVRDWEDWRHQLNTAAARLERAKARANPIDKKADDESIHQPVTRVGNPRALELLEKGRR